MNNYHTDRGIPGNSSSLPLLYCDITGTPTYLQLIRTKPKHFHILEPTSADRSDVTLKSKLDQ